MSGQAPFSLRGRNPDVLTCIANLSNDEVFTPPELANRMLDTLAAAWAADHGGADIWADSTLRFLDPCAKSGVFLREITSRLIKGLAGEMPDLRQRVEHILTRQVYGIGITQLTSLLARRSLYCSKYANGQHSIVRSFASDAGNIWFQRTVMGHHGHGTRINLLSHAPNVQVRDPRVSGVIISFDHLPNLVNHRVIHFAIEQHLARVGDQTLGPDGNQHGTDDTHERVEPRPAEHPTAKQCCNGKHRSRSVGDHMQVGRLQIEVVVLIMVVVMVAVIMSV